MSEEEQICEKDLAIAGREVYTWRMAANLTQEAMGKLCCLHPNQIGRFEKGQPNADLKTLIKFSFAMPVNLLAGLQMPVEALPENNTLAKERIEARLHLVQYQIGQRILQILESQGKEQRELALDLRMEDSEISKYAHGLINIQYLSLVKIAGKLKTPVSSLLHQ
jgi:transcriptional regulator with XRE-family HTH domain